LPSDSPYSVYLPYMPATKSKNQSRTFAKNSVNKKVSKVTALGTNRLYRSETDCMIAGVCSGIADYFGIDASLVRILFITITLFGGSGILLYILLWVVVPSESAVAEQQPKNTIYENIQEIKKTARDFAQAVKSEKRWNSSQNWTGIFVVLVGVYFLLANFGIINWFPIGKLWPLILIIIGLSLFWKRHG
jgi:phage shock protein C